MYNVPYVPLSPATKDKNTLTSHTKCQLAIANTLRSANDATTTTAVGGRATTSLPTSLKKNTCTCVRLLIQSVHEFGERVSFSQGSARDDQTIPKAPRQPSMRPHCIIEWVTDGPPKLARRAPRCGGARLCSAPGRPVAGPGDSRAARLGLGDRSGASPRTPRRGECRQKKSASAGRDEGSRMDGRATAST